MSNKRIYHVTNHKGRSHRLVRSTSASQARSFVARAEYSVEVASQEALVGLLGSGIKVEDATETEPTAEPEGEPA